jgi:hypothetical protein
MNEDAAIRSFSADSSVSASAERGSVAFPSAEPAFPSGALARALALALALALVLVRRRFAAGAAASSSACAPAGAAAAEDAEAAGAVLGSTPSVRSSSLSSACEAGPRTGSRWAAAISLSSIRYRPQSVSVELNQSRLLDKHTPRSQFRKSSQRVRKRPALVTRSTTRAASRMLSGELSQRCQRP